MSTQILRITCSRASCPISLHTQLPKPQTEKRMNKGIIVKYHCLHHTSEHTHTQHTHIPTNNLNYYNLDFDTKSIYALLITTLPVSFTDVVK